MDQPVHNVQHSHVPQPGDAARPIQLPQTFQHNIRQAVTGPAQAFLPHESAAVLGKLGTASELDPFDDSDDHGRSPPRPFSWSNAASTCSSENNSTEVLRRVREADHKDHPPAHPANAGDPPATPHSCHVSAPEATMMDINKGSAYPGITIPALSEFLLRGQPTHRHLILMRNLVIDGIIDLVSTRLPSWAEPSKRTRRALASRKVLGARRPQSSGFIR